MKSLSEIHVNEILAGGYALVETGTEAHALASAVSRHTGRRVDVTFQGAAAVRVELADPAQPPPRITSKVGGPLAYPAPGRTDTGRISGVAPPVELTRRAPERRSGTERRRPLAWSETWAEPNPEYPRPSTPVTPSGAPEATPCDDCTTEAATYRAIPVDEATIEFVFLKSRKFRGGPTPAELQQLIDDSLAAFPALDYAEVVATRERHKFELSCGDRLRTARTRMAKIRELKGGN
jgi:hypothetical protein